MQTVILSCKHEKEVDLPEDFDLQAAGFGASTSCPYGCGERMIVGARPIITERA